MRKKLLLSILSVCSALLLFACHQGQEVDPSVNGLRITFAPTGARPADDQLRATELGEERANENAVQQVAVTFLKSDGSHAWTPAAGDCILSDNAVTIRKRALQALSVGETYQIWLFANLPTGTDLSGKSLTELKALQLDFVELPNENGVTLRQGIPMWGKVDSYSHMLDATTLGHVELKRLFAKIRVKVFSKDGFIPSRTPKEDGFWGVPQVQLLGTNLQANILPTLPSPIKKMDLSHWVPLSRQSSQTVAGEGANELSYCTHQVPIYSTPMEWAEEMLYTPKVIIKIPLYMGNTPNQAEQSDAIWHYYTVPLVRSDADQGLKGNFLYDLLVNIDTSGSTEEQRPRTIQGTLEEQLWQGDHNLDVDLAHQAEYLHLSPAEAEMYSTEYRIKYLSSKPIGRTVIQSVTQEYTTYKRGTGEPIPNKQDITSTVDIQLDSDKHEIIFKRELPKNNAPYKYTISIKAPWMAEARKVTLTQYPAIVVRGIQSRDVVNTATSPNPTLFVFRFPHSKVSADVSSIDYKLGYPNITNPSEADARIVSPHFIVASFAKGDKSGATWNTYEKAKKFCEEYSETTTEGITYTNWRLPTRAELEIMNAVTSKSSGITNGESIILHSNTGNYRSLDEPQRGGRVRPVRDLK